MLPDITPPTQPQSPDTSDDTECLSEVWIDLDWSPWVPFDAPRDYFYIPREPGVYRIRPAGKDFLLYIGETGQTLHKKIAELRQSLRRGDLMPWSDPHDVAPCLWAYWVEWLKESDLEEPVEPVIGEDGEPEKPASFMLECSAAPLDASPAGRKGMQAFLLSRYRQDFGQSPHCNFGRFHPRYRKSTTRAQGKRGGKLADSHKDNPAGFSSIEPLEATGTPGNRDWMGLEWTAWQDLHEENANRVDSGAGLYLLADAGSHEILYIGHSADVRKRLSDLCHKTWDERALVFSYQIIGQSVLPHNLKELETDLVGHFYECYKKAPEFQYRNPSGSLKA